MQNIVPFQVMHSGTAGRTDFDEKRRKIQKFQSFSVHTSVVP